MSHEKIPASGCPEDAPAQEADSPNPVESFDDGGSAETLTAYIERLDDEYRDKLHGLLTDCMNQLSDEKRELISSHPEP